MKGQSVLHYIRCFLNIDQPVTQATLNERTSMLKYVKEAKAIAEIGVFEGFNTREFALHSPADTVVYAIDPFFKGALGISYGKLIALNNWKKKKINKIKLIQGFSADVSGFINEPLDFVFVDGDHTYDGVKKDFELYGEKLSDNGTIAFHDSRLFPQGWTQSDWGPVQLIDNIVRKDKKWKIVEEVDSTVFIKKA